MPPTREPHVPHHQVPPPAAPGWAPPQPHPPPAGGAAGGPVPGGWPQPDPQWARHPQHHHGGWASPAWPTPPAGSAGTEAPPSAGVLVGVTLWRVGIGSLALYYAQTGKDETMSSESLSYLSNVGVGIGFLALAAYPLLAGGRRHEPSTAWLRGALTIMMLLVGLVFTVGMGEEPDGPHAVIPALVTVDWLLVGRSQFRTRPWEPLTWIVFPLLYLVYHQANDIPLYEDILGEDNIGTMVPALLAGCIVLGYVLYLAALVRRAASRGRT